MPGAGPNVKLKFGGVRLGDPRDRKFAYNTWFDDGLWRIRKGFGTRAEFDIAFGAVSIGSTPHGIEQHCGSHELTTSFGNKQILSLFSVQHDTGSARTPGTRESTDRFYVVKIFDMTSGGVWEQIVMRLAGDQPHRDGIVDDGLMGKRRYYYESSRECRFDVLVKASSEPARAWFADLFGVVYFGNDETGPLAYFPAIIPRNQFGEGRRGRQRENIWGRHPHIDNHAFFVDQDGRGEPCIVRALVPAPGLQDVNYIRAGELPEITTGFAHEGRLVLISGRTVFFSDTPATGSAASFAVDNNFDVPDTDTLVAGVSVRGSILLFTLKSTWVYSPSRGFLASQGPLNRTNDGVGCLGQESIVLTDEGLAVWASRRGVHAASTVSNITTLSGDIEPFFTDFVENPFSAHVAGSTHVHAVGRDPDAQSRASWRLDKTGLVAAYWGKEKLLLFSSPGQNLILVFMVDKQEWAFWPLESVVFGDVEDIGGFELYLGAKKNLPEPWVLANEDNIWLMTGPYSQSVTNVGPITSFALTEYGYSGSLDRSHESEDDQRQGVKTWVMRDPSSVFPTLARRLYLEVGIPMPMIPGEPVLGVSGSEAPEGGIWAPINVHWSEFGNVSAGVQIVDFRFRIDRTLWDPVFTSGALAAFVTASERIGTAIGWSVTMEDLGGVPDASGEYVHVEFDGTGHPAGSWTTQPHLNLSDDRTVPLIWIPFHPVAVSGDARGTSRTGLTLSVDTAQLEDPPNGSEVTYAWMWAESWLGKDGNENNSQAQAVDWLQRTEAVNVEGYDRVCLRTVYPWIIAGGQQVWTGAPYPDADPVSDPFSAGRIVPPHPLSLFNVAFSRDERSSMLQVLDIPLLVDSTKLSVPALRLEEFFPGTLRYKAFLSPDKFRRLVWSSDGPKYSHAASPPAADAGKFIALASGREHARLAVSSKVTGQTVEAVFYGAVRGWAEYLHLVSAQARVQPRGKRRVQRR